MQHTYKTISHLGIAEIIVKKSRFIGHVKPASSELEAVQFIDAIKKEHWNAAHNCFAYVAGERDEFQKQSDDGEPSGTAGKPILEVLKQQGLKNVIVVVTRYFGGIMLGAGGLIRAYTAAAAAGIEAAVPAIQVLHQEVWIEVDYTWFGKIENEARSRQMMMGETQFTDKVRLLCLPLFSEAESLIESLNDWTQGQGEITRGDAKYIAHTKQDVEVNGK